MANDTEWLNEQEMAAWVAVIHATKLLFERLESDLAEAHDLSHGDYEILVLLSEAPDHRLRMTELAEHMVMPKSRLTYRADHLERRGIIERFNCPSDRRGMFAHLTAEGLALLQRAAPTHVAGVRSHLLDHATPGQITTIAEVFGKVRDALG